MPELVRFKPHKLKFRTKAACRIVGIDPQRLNEAIAAKDGYSCAPKTRPGVSRIFDEFDLMSLYVFRRLTEEGFSQKLASNYACGLLAALKSNYHTLPERLDFPLDGFNDMWTAEIRSEPVSFTSPSQTVGIASFSIDIVGIRKIICALMEDEANILGEED
jgi:hypothetical protein